MHNATRMLPPAFRFSSLTAVVASLMAATTALAAIPNPGGPAGGEFQINTTSTQDQEMPSVASDAAGDSLVAWESTQDNHGIYARLYGPDGQPVGPEFLVHTDPFKSQHDVAVAADAGGDFVLVWTSVGEDFSTAMLVSDVLAQRYDKHGTPLGGTFQVNQTHAGNQFFGQTVVDPRPAVAMDAAGNFVVAWTSIGQDGDGLGVFAQRFDKNGNALTGADIPVNVTTAGSQSGAAAAMSPSGAYVISWTGLDAGNGVTPDAGVYAQLYAADGSVVKPEFLVNTHTSGIQGLSSDGMDAAGNFVIAWASNGQDGSGFGIYAQRFDAAGAPVGAEFLVNTAHTTSDQINPAVAMDPQGEFAIYFTDIADVFGEIYSANGTPQAGGQANTFTANSQQNPAVAMDAGGDLFVAWMSLAQDGDNFGVFGQRFVRLGSIDLSASLDASPTAAKPGDTVTLTASIGNQQPAVTPSGIPAVDNAITAASSLQAAITLPSGMVFSSASGSHWTCPDAPSGQVLTCSYDANVAAGDATADLTVNLQAGDSAGVQAFTSDVSGAQPDAAAPNNEASAGVTVDHPPVAHDVVLAVALNSSNSSGTLSADDVDGDTLTFSKVAGPGHGAATVNANGSFSYTPNNGFSGHDSFTFKANDGNLDSNDGTVTVRVDNHAPVANDGTLTVAQDSSGNAGTVTASDPDGDPLTFSKASDPAHGTVTVDTGGGFNYVPNAGFSGTDSFSFKANDGLADSNIGTVTVTVHAGNQAPVASDGVLTVDEDSSNDTGSLAASDPDGDPIVFSKASGPAHGSVTVHADGSYSYTPDALFFGTDSFTFKVNDGVADSNAATVTVTVNHVNHAPAASDGVLTVAEDSTNDAGTLSASDADTGDTLTFSKVGNPAHGSVTVGADGSYSYTPDALFFGTDSFTFKVNDGTVDSNTATVSITVTHVNHAPSASDGLLTVNEDSSNDAGTLTAGDLDNDVLVFSKVSDPAHGTVTVNANGSYHYTPSALFFGTDSFTFKANDGTADSAAATVTITVNHVNHLPVAHNGTLTVNKNSAGNVGQLSASDADAGDTLTFLRQTLPSHGALEVNQTDGSYVYTPDSGFSGTDSFTFAVADGITDSGVATVTITVVNHAPSAAAGTLAVNRNTAKAGTAAGSDPDGDSLTLSVVTQGAHGTVVMQPDGSFSYTPARGFTGADSFTFKANDGTADSAPATVSVTVTEHAPVGLAQTFSMTRNTVHKGALKVSDKDTGDKHSFSKSVAPKHGTVVINLTTGAFSYTPARNFIGKDSFVFKVSDGLKSDTATVNITVK